MVHRRAKSRRKLELRKKIKKWLEQRKRRLLRRIRRFRISALKEEIVAKRRKLREQYTYLIEMRPIDLFREWIRDAIEEREKRYEYFRKLSYKEFVKILLKAYVKGHAIRVTYRRDSELALTELEKLWSDIWDTLMESTLLLSRYKYLGVDPTWANAGKIEAIAELIYYPMRLDECHATISGIRVSDVTMKFLQGKEGTVYILISGNFEHYVWDYTVRKSHTTLGVEPFFILLMAKKRKGERFSLKVLSGEGVINDNLQVIAVSNNLRMPLERIPLKELLDDPYQILRLRAESIGRPEATTKLILCSLVAVVGRRPKYAKDIEAITDPYQAMEKWEATDPLYFKIPLWLIPLPTLINSLVFGIGRGQQLLCWGLP